MLSAGTIDMASKTPIGIDGMADVVAAVTAFQDVGEERHCKSSPSTRSLLSLAQGIRRVHIQRVRNNALLESRPGLP